MKYQDLQDDYPLSEEQVSAYRRDGFIKLDNVLIGETLRAVREAVVRAVEAEKEMNVMGLDKPVSQAADNQGYNQIFTQRVNLWQRHPAIKEFVLAPRLANLAARLSGKAVRIWHDQALFKDALTGANTPWHQDAPYWPHADRSHQLSIWIALEDATVENGCMSFIPGTHKLGPKEPVKLGPNAKNVYEVAPEAKGIKPVTHQLKAGSATFHNGLTFHYAGPNRSDKTREAFVVIYMPEDTAYSGKSHVVTDGKSLEIGQILDGADFPKVST